MGKKLLLVFIIVLLCSGCSGNTNSYNNNSVKSGKEEEKTEPIEIKTDILEDEDKNIHTLSKDEFDRIEEVIKIYYDSINQTIISMELIDKIPTFESEYDGYDSKELVFFEVLVENSEMKRYIVVGSKDNWNNCDVLNEGY